MGFTRIMIAAAIVGSIVSAATGAEPAEKARAKAAKSKAALGKAAAEPKAARIADLLREPKSYAGEDVAVKGIFAGACCASDWFLKDGVDTIEIYSTKMCPMPPRSKVRSKVTVIGTVMVRNDHPAITAKELRFE